MQWTYCRASIEMQDLVQTFLQLARGDSNPGATNSKRSLVLVAEELVKRWQPLFQDKKLDLHYEVRETDHGSYNPVLLGSVIANLLRNALHYTEQGNVRLVLLDGGFYVEDSGIGIPLEQQQNIFQPFISRLQARGEGSGLGLSSG